MNAWRSKTRIAGGTVGSNQLSQLLTDNFSFLELAFGKEQGRYKCSAADRSQQHFQV